MRALRRRPALLAIAAWVALGSLAGVSHAQPGAQRIVSINPSLTEILVALGAEDRLVGVDDFSASAQPSVADLPRVGGLYSSSVEAVAALRPDLVVWVPSVQQRAFRAQLSELGVRVREFDPRSFADVIATVKALGEETGLAAAAAERIAAIEAVRAELERKSREQPRRRVVLVLQREPLYVVGRGSFIDEMIASVGGENLAGALSDGYPRASLEWLIAAAPEVLLDASHEPTPAAEHWARWPSLAAARVVALPSGVATLPGPYLDRALGVLFEAVQGEKAPAAAAQR